MTIQDKKIPGMGVGGDFIRSTHAKAFSYPQDRLSLFLNFKSSDLKEIQKFCTENKMLPPMDLENGVYPAEGFKKLQLALRTLAYNLQNRSITPDMLKSLNEGLSGNRLLIGYPNSPEILLTGTPNPTGVFKNTVLKPEHLVISYSDENGISSLFIDLIKYTIENQNLRNCSKCGNFFIKLSKQNKKYCNDKCKEAARDIRKKASKK